MKTGVSWLLCTLLGLACRERARQARANRLSHAIQQLEDDGDKENSLDLAQQQRPLYSLLQPAEAALVEQLLAQVSPHSNPL